jgi:glycosyltransferase involved in cell wall biosynthesis
MKILIFTTDLARASPSRIHYLIRFLLSKQINIRVVDFSFYQGNVSFVAYLKSAISLTSKASRQNGTTIRFPCLPAATNHRTNLTSLIHFLHLMLAILLSKMIIRSIEYDVVVSTDPAASFVATSVAKPGAFFVYEDLDYFADLNKGKIQRMFISFLEKYCIRRASLVICVSKPLVRRARILNPRADSLLIPNGVDLSRFTNPHGNPRELSLVYVGSLDETRASFLKLVIEAFPLLRRKIPGITMRVAGEGNEKPMLEELVSALSLQDSIFILGGLSYDKVAALLQSSSVGIAMFKPSKAAAFASPLKLFDYMAAGVPVVATDIGDVGRIVKESMAGVAIRWNVHEFMEAVVNLLTNGDLWSRCHENGLRYVGKYDWNNLFEEWLQEIQRRAWESKTFA